MSKTFCSIFFCVFKKQFFNLLQFIRVKKNKIKTPPGFEKSRKFDL